MLTRHQFGILVVIIAGAGIAAAAWVAQPPKSEVHNLDFCFEDGRLQIGCEAAAGEAAARRIDELLKE